MGSGNQCAAVRLLTGGGRIDHFIDEADVEAGAFEKALEHAVHKIVSEAGYFSGFGEILAAPIYDNTQGGRGEELASASANQGA